MDESKYTRIRNRQKPTRQTPADINLQMNLFNTWRQYNVSEYYQNIVTSYLDELPRQQLQQRIAFQIKQTIQQKSPFFQLQTLNISRKTVLKKLQFLIQNYKQQSLTQICSLLSILRQNNLQTAQITLKMYNMFQCQDKNNLNTQIRYYQYIFNKLDKDMAFLKRSVLNKYISFSQGYDPFLMNHYQKFHRERKNQPQPIKNLFSINISYAYRLMRVKNMILQVNSKPVARQEIDQERRDLEYTQARLDSSTIQGVGARDAAIQRSSFQNSRSQVSEALTSPQKIIPVRAYNIGTTRLRKSYYLFDNKSPQIIKYANQYTEAPNRKKYSIAYLPLQKPKYYETQPRQQKQEFSPQVKYFRRASQPHAINSLNKNNLGQVSRPIKLIPITQPKNNNKQKQSDTEIVYKRIKTVTDHKANDQQSYEIINYNPVTKQNYLKSKKKLTTSKYTFNHQFMQEKQKNEKRSPGKISNHNLTKPLQEGLVDELPIQKTGGRLQTFLKQLVARPSHQHRIQSEKLSKYEHQKYKDKNIQQSKDNNKFQKNIKKQVASQAIQTSPQNNMLTRQEYQIKNDNKAKDSKEATLYVQKLDYTNNQINNFQNPIYNSRPFIKWSQFTKQGQKTFVQPQVITSNSIQKSSFVPQRNSYQNQESTQPQDKIMYPNQVSSFQSQNRSVPNTNTNAKVVPNAQNYAIEQRNGSNNTKASLKNDTNNAPKTLNSSYKPQNVIYQSQNSPIQKLNSIMKTNQSPNQYQNTQKIDKKPQQIKNIQSEHVNQNSLQPQSSNRPLQVNPSVPRDLSVSSSSLTSYKNQLKMINGKSTLLEVISLLKTANFAPQYKKYFDLPKLQAWIQVSQTYLTQFHVNNQLGAVGMCSYIPNIGMALKFWAPIQPHIDLKISQSLFVKYIQLIQKTTTVAKILYSGPIFPEIQAAGFTMKKQNLYQKSRSTPLPKIEKQFKPFLYVQCSNIKYPQIGQEVALYSQDIQAFTSNNSYIHLALSNINHTILPESVQTLVKVNKQLMNFQQVNAILTKQEFDNYQTTGLQISHIDLLRLYLNSPLKSTFIAQDGRFKFSGALHFEDGEACVVSVPMLILNGSIFFAKNVNMKTFIQKIGMPSTLTTSFSVMMFSKKIYGKLPQYPRGHYGNWQINFTWEDQMSGRIKHNMNEQRSFGNQSFLIGIIVQNQLLYCAQINKDDFLV